MATPGCKRAQKGFIEEAMNQWWKDSNSITVLITGKTGTGKSSLVNAILGKEVATVGKKLDPQTTEVSSFDTSVDGIKVIVWDSPGLQDGLNNEAAYLHDIETNCKGKIDLFLCCISMENKRFLTGSRDIESMIKLTDKLGKEIWDNAVLVLTCANKFISSKKSTMVNCDDLNEKIKKIFTEQLETWKTKLMKCLKEDLHLSIETVMKIPILPAGRRGLPVLLNGLSPWLSDLWMESLLATKRNAQPALVKMNLHRLKNASDIHSEEEFKELLKREYVIINDKAGEIGKLLNAREAASSVGKLSGVRASLAHLLERMFSSNPYITVLGTTVAINQEKGFIAARVHCMLHLPHP